MPPQQPSQAIAFMGEQDAGMFDPRHLLTDRVVCWTHGTAGVPGDERFECAGCITAREIAVSRAHTRFLQIIADGERNR